jgi:hypothetical protein
MGADGMFSRCCWLFCDAVEGVFVSSPTSLNWWQIINQILPAYQAKFGLHH